MPMWRCPHCGTPQAETARCWVCRRSSTTCSTCRHYRRSVAAQVGYCGLDRRRLPLTGSELRGCWEAGPARIADLPSDPISDDAVEAPSPALRLRGFIPVELRRLDPAAARAGRAQVPTTPPAQVEIVDPGVAAAPTHPPTAWADRATLFADSEL